MSDTTSSRRLMMTGGALALAAVCALGLRWWSVGSAMIETDDAYVRADIVTVAPRVAGMVVAVEVADNQSVRAGQVLVRIDDRDARLKVEQARGALASAQAQVAEQQARIANLDARTVQQRSAIAQADAALAARKADADLATRDARRQDTLARQQVTSDQLLQTAHAAARRTGAGEREARAALTAARDHLPVLATERMADLAELDMARGALQQAQAALNAALLDLERTIVRAPIAGQVGQRTVRVGHYADVGTPLMALVPAQSYVVANYKETQSARIRPGQSVSIAVEALDTVLKGHVDSFAPASGAQFALLPPDNATGNFTRIVQRLPLRITIDPGQPMAANLRPGMSVETSVDTRP
jgi:membrane fusion protein, multidrug efflux system